MQLISKDMQNPGEDWIPIKWMRAEFIKLHTYAHRKK
jgi:hypothetical protein